MTNHRSVIAIGVVTTVLVAHCERALATGEQSARKQLSHSELETVLADDSWVVVDARKTDAFNGWALEGIQRGGQIPGVIDFSATWLEVDIENRVHDAVN